MVQSCHHLIHIDGVSVVGGCLLPASSVVVTEIHFVTVLTVQHLIRAAFKTIFMAYPTSFTNERAKQTSMAPPDGLGSER